MDAIYIIDSVLGISKPSPDAIKKHQQKVKKAIDQMGDKYRLSIYVQKKDKKNEIT